MQDAVFKVKADLGADAVILHTRKVRQGGFFGLFGKKLIEVIATVEEQREAEVAKELREELNTLRERIQQMDQKEQELQEAKKVTATQPNHQLMFPGKLQMYAEKLVQEGLAIDIVNEIGQIIIDRLEIYQLHKEDVVYRTLLDVMAEMIPIASPIDLKPQKRVMAFVGPTGVGKTTTIAKLAAQIALKGEKRVGLITADTYRIAAVEQLKTYSDIINVPLRVIYNSDELETALDELNYCDLIFIDTAGRSQRNDSQMAQLKEILPKGLIDETHLVIAMNTGYEEMFDIIQRFGQLVLSSLIFTKQDESSKRGTIMNILKKTPYQISYITFGQDVPEDIEEANPRRIAEMILKE